jgi:uncharacterized protein (TIGR02145 family)
MNRAQFFIAIACTVPFFSCSSDSDDCSSNLSSGTFIDSRDGQVYRSAEIGCQTWMAENLNYKTPKSICYNETQENCEKYGRLYAWEDAVKSCPSGWHLPSEKEWCVLVDCGDGQYHSGKKLKSKDGWDNYGERNGNGTDEYGFTALPGGRAHFMRNIIGGTLDYYSMGTIGYWWIAAENEGDFSAILFGSGGDEAVPEAFSTGLYSQTRAYYFHSIRCIKGSGNSDDKEEPKNLFFNDKRDGKKYRYTIIGTQTWMAENLNYKTAESKCYNDSLVHCEKFGRLYNWKEAMSTCPSGWHLPSEEELDILVNYVGAYGAKVGDKLKATEGWYSYEDEDANGTDDYGFTALPGGYGSYHDSSHSFSNVNHTGVLWSTQEHDANNAYGTYIGYEPNFVTSYIGGDDKRSIFSVRCIKDSK